MDNLSPESYTVQRFEPEPRRDKKERRKAERIIASAADLRRKVFPPIRWLVRDYIPEGCTLLAGRPKLGKSWLMLDIALAVAGARTCLGNIPCDQGDVLYLALEDNERRLQSRIDRLEGMLAPEWPAAFRYATEWPRANEGGLEAIREWIEAVENPRLVVVDVLAMFKPVRGDKESLYEADYNSLKGLQELAGEFNIAIVVVHHTRKSGGEFDPFEKVSGTLGLSGAADTTMILDRDGNGATLYVRGRDAPEKEAAVTFDRDACRWRVLGEAAEIRRTDERSLILDVLKGADEPMSPAEIADAIGAPRNNVKQLIFKMSKTAEVLKVGTKGRYIHPDRHDLDNRPDHHNPDNPITAPSAPDEEAALGHGEPVTAVTAVMGGSEVIAVDEALAEGRLIREAEKREPGIVRAILNGLVERREEPSPGAFMAALARARGPEPVEEAPAADDQSSKVGWWREGWRFDDNDGAPLPAPAQNPQAPPPDGLTIGLRVRHGKFGVGAVAAIYGNKISVVFDIPGNKMVLAGFLTHEDGTPLAEAGGAGP